MKILLVEDNPLSARLLSKFLTRANHEITHVMYGLEGLKLARQGGFDVILMDFQLPDIDGSQIGLVLRNQLKGTPIIALTADNDRITRKKALAFGFDAFLTKPIDFPELLRTLETLGTRLKS